jgi:type IV secretory pathway TrbD component
MRIAALGFDARPVRYLGRAAVLAVTSPRLLVQKVRFVLNRSLSSARGTLLRAVSNRYTRLVHKTTRQVIVAAQIEPPATKLYADAVALHARSKHALVPAIEMLSSAFVLDPAPHVALKLSELQRLANRHEDALETLRKAFRAHPENREIWYHAIIYLMRHGSTAATKDALESILQRDPDHELAKFFAALLSGFSRQAQSLSSALAAARDESRPSLVLGFAVWGDRYTHLFLNYALPSLLAAGNMPALAKSHDIHVVAFTSGEHAEIIRASPVYGQVSNHATMHLVAYDSDLMSVAYAEDFAVACHARFGLMSNAHYAILECARRFAMPAIILGADNVVNETFLSSIATMSAAGASAVVCPGFRLPANRALVTVNQLCRGTDGSISITNGTFARVLSGCLQDEWFVDSANFARFPLFLCWRVDGEGVLVHANHLHPVMINGKYLREIKYPSIDPIDGRFLVRYLADTERIEVCTNSDIALFDAAECALVVEDAGAVNAFDPAEVGLWLWQFNDGLREKYFGTPVRYAFEAVSPDRWAEVEATAASTIAEAVTRMRELEAQSAMGRSWCLQPAPNS